MSGVRRWTTKGIRDTILTYAQKLTQVSLIYRTEPKTKKWRTKKTKKTDMPRESVESVLEQKEESYDGKDLQKGKVLSLEWKSEVSK